MMKIDDKETSKTFTILKNLCIVGFKNSFAVANRLVNKAAHISICIYFFNRLFYFFHQKVNIYIYISVLYDVN